MDPRKPASCTNCVYRDQPGFNPGHLGTTPGLQPTQPVEIFFVGEALGNDEIAKGYNFAGGSGRVLDALLAEANLDRTNCYFSNVVRCHPPGNEDPHPQAIQSCRDFLTEELVRIRPNLIVGLGNTPLGWFTGDPTKIQSRRGSVYNTPFGKFMAVIHPAAVMRVKQKFWPITRWDLKRAAKECKYPENRHQEDFDWWPTLEVIELFCTEATVRGWINWDIETSYGNSLVRFGMGWRDKSISIPFITGGGSTIPYYSDLDERRIVELLYDLMADPAVQKRGHNSMNYDGFHMQNLGFNVVNQADSIVRHHCLYPELEHKLETVAATHSTVPYYKDEAKGRGEMSKQNPERVGQYNCKDVKAQDESFDDITWRLKGLGMLALCEQMAEPMQEVACDGLKRRGVYTDQRELDAQGNALLGTVEVTRDFLEGLTWPGFNPSTNSQDIPRLLHECWRYPVLAWTDKTHKPKADEDTFLKIKERVTDPNHSHVLDLVLEYRQNRKLYTSWTEDFYPDLDGRLHSDWLAYRTRTGRLASYPNVQNLPTSEGGRYRRIFRAQFPDTILQLGDCKQAELRYNAYLAGDEPLITTFQKFDAICLEIENYELTNRTVPDSLRSAKYEWDPHVRNACDMWGCKPGDVSKEQRFRGKIFVFGILYGGTAESVLAHGGRGLTRSTANLALLKSMERNWWLKHPALRAHLDGIESQVRKYRELTDPLGWRRQFFGPVGEAVREGWDYFPQRGIANLMNRAHIPLERWCRENLKTDRIACGSWGPVLQIHDAIISEIPRDRQAEYRTEMRRLIEQPYTIKGKDYIFPADFISGERFSDLR